MQALAILSILLLLLALLTSASAAVSSQVHLVRLPPPSLLAQSWRTEHAPSPTHLATNYRVFWRRRRHYHQKGQHVASPAPATSILDCSQTCLEPLTSAPMGSPCGCVIPMKVKLRLSVAVYIFFPLVHEFEIEVAAGTYLERSQVQIVGAGSSIEDHEKTDVDVNLVPLGDKFDNTTVTLTYERFVKKEVPLNRSFLGGYEVVSIIYPGIPSSLPSENDIASDPVAGIGDGQNPMSANIVVRNRRMNSKTVFIIVFSAVLMLLACVAAIYVFLKCWKLRTSSSAVRPAFASSVNRKSGTGFTVSCSNECSTSTSPLTSVPTCALSVKTFTLAELEKATEKFSSRRILGEGGFGRVYYGILEDETEVAVKLLGRDNPNGDREFISEVEMLSRLHHRNLVKLIGICIEGHSRCLVYELVHNGSVESHLHGVDRENGPLDWDSRMKIALGAARGLAYLHEDSNPRVIHRDFKASNVLLEDDFTPKVSDFGLAREAKEGSHVSTRVMGTFGYVAPEYAMTGHLLVKSDVYSYGVVLLELLSGRKPVDMSQPQGQENLVTWARPLLTTREGIEQLVDPALSDGPDNFHDISKVAAIASMCVHLEVSNRPFMGEVVQALKLIYSDTNEAFGDDGSSQRDTSIQGSYSRSDLGPSERSWWNAGAISPHLTYGQASPFITMEYSSGPLEEMENRHQHSTLSLAGGERVALPINHGNRSGPLRFVRSKPNFFRLKGSVSEHGGLLPKRTWKSSYSRRWRQLPGQKVTA